MDPSGSAEYSQITLPCRISSRDGMCNVGSSRSVFPQEVREILHLPHYLYGLASSQFAYSACLLFDGHAECPSSVPPIILVLLTFALPVHERCANSLQKVLTRSIDISHSTDAGAVRDCQKLHGLRERSPPPGVLPELIQ